MEETDIAPISSSLEDQWTQAQKDFQNRSVFEECQHLNQAQIQLLILEELRLLNNTLAPFAAKYAPLGGRRWGKS